MSVSIIMSVYNGEKYLAAAIDSVLGQTIHDFELVIINDGSRDSTQQIVDTYARRDSRIVTLQQENKGAAAARNTGVRRATYDLVAIMDSDDVMLTNRLERQLSFMKSHPQISVASSYGYLIDINGKQIGVSKYIVDVKRAIDEFNPKLFSEILHSTVMMKKRDLLAIGGYREGLEDFTEDRDLWGRFVTEGYEILTQPEFLVEYRLHSTALSMQNHRKKMLICDYIDANVIRRLRRESELDLQQYMKILAKRSLREKLATYVESAALYHYKKATRFYGEQRWFKLAVSLGIAMSIQPKATLQRIFTKAKFN